MDTALEQLRSIVDSGLAGAWIAAIVLVVAIAILSRLITMGIRKLMQVDGFPLPESTILVNIVRIIVWAVGISFILSACFNVDVNALLAALGIGGIALSLGLQDTFKNFIGGIQVTMLRIVRPGDHIVVNDVEGIVQDVSWRQTVVKDYENNIHLIPNAVINSTTVTKVTPENIVTTPISFTNDGRDLDAMVHEMELLATEAVQKVAPLEKDSWILLTQIGEYGTWGKMRFVLKDTTHAREARDAALRAIAPYTRNDSSAMLNDEEA